jgi:hypothetical protein
LVPGGEQVDLSVDRKRQCIRPQSGSGTGRARMPVPAVSAGGVQGVSSGNAAGTRYPRIGVG